MNGIAFDAEGDRLFVTGKLWESLYEIEVCMLLAVVNVCFVFCVFVFLCFVFCVLYFVSDFMCMAGANRGVGQSYPMAKVTCRN